MRAKWILAGVAGLALAAGGAAKAVDEGGKPGGRFADRPLARLIQGRIGRGMELRSELNLSDEQKQAIKTTLEAHKGEIAKAIGPVAEKKRALRDAVLAEKGDEKAIRAAADDVGKAMGDAAVVLAKVKTELKANAKLTEEQMKKISDLREKNDAAMDRFFKDAAAK